MALCSGESGVGRKDILAIRNYISILKDTSNRLRVNPKKRVALRATLFGSGIWLVCFTGPQVMNSWLEEPQPARVLSRLHQLGEPVGAQQPQKSPWREPAGAPGLLSEDFAEAAQPIRRLQEPAGQLSEPL